MDIIEVLEQQDNTICQQAEQIKALSNMVKQLTEQLLQLQALSQEDAND